MGFAIMLLIFNLLLQLVSARDHLPTCIIGGGPTGLTLAHKFIERGVYTIVFDSQAAPGGKVQTWRGPNNDHQIEMGAVIFSNNSRNSMELFNKYGFHLREVPHSEHTSFKAGTNETEKVPPKDASELTKLYLAKRSQVDLSPGYLNADPKLFVSLGEWLTENGLEAMIPISQIFLTVSGYGSVFETPALYGLNIIDENGDPNSPVYSVVEGLDKVFAAYAKGIDLRLNTEVTKIEKVYNKVKLYINYPDYTDQQICERVITAFPPYHKKMMKLIDNESILSALEPVVLTKYATFVTENPHLTDYAYFTTLGSQKARPQQPPGEGHLVGMLKQLNGYAGYSWYDGASKTPASPEEVKNMKDLLIEDVDALTSSPGSTNNPHHSNWDYFPHVSTKDLPGFHAKLHEAQGSDGIYIAGPIHLFESINFSIEGANYFFNKYFPSA